MIEPGGVRSAAGPRAVDAGWLAEVERACGEAERDPTRLARPLRVVVPSASLREHVARALIERSGRARVGLRIQTLDALAREILERAGLTPASALLHPVAVRDAARAEGGLAGELDRLEDGYAPVLASVDDLLDAGFTADHTEAVLERVDEVAGGALRARTAALVRVAAAVAHELAAGTLGHRSAELTRAAGCLRDAPPPGADALLPTRTLWIHGFADATGVQLDLLETLALRFETRVWLDRPAAASASTFGARLRERFAPGAAEDAAPPPSVAVLATRHGDPEAEARAAAAWARARLDAGDAPERIAIVARDLGRHRIALRRQLWRYGVPFSGHAERGAAGAASRALGALGELLERGAALPAERWLDALGPGAGPAAARADLRDALHVAGAATLGELAADRPWPAELVLPARTGLACDGDGRPIAPERRVPRSAIAALRDAARAALRHLEGEPERAPLAVHAARLEWLVELLGWDPSTPGRVGLAAALPEPERAGDRPVRRDDAVRLLRRALAEAGRDRLGGQGGGVQVLTVMEARARSFDALRVIGLNRGLFPRPIAEDPLLPDGLRRALRDVLPDLPVKAEGHEEERFLFAQLLAAAPRVHLSCARRDTRGREAPASPLLERAAIPWSDAPEAELASRADALLHTALRAGRAEFARALPAALDEGRDALGLGAAPALAAARLDALAELDPRGPRPPDPGPFLGWVGAPAGPADPRRAPPSVTHLERIAHCPWQAFLERTLRLAPPPDAGGPLPAAGDARRVGNVVHGALERIAADTEAEAAGGARIDTHLLAAAEHEVRGAGIALPGFARALARRAAPFVAVALRLEGIASARPATRVSVEVPYAVELVDAAGVRRALHFRADRADAAEDGTDLVLTDWKTGTSGTPKRQPAARREDHRRRLARGELLQGHAYALAGGRGRYVYLHPDLDDEARVLEAEPEGPQRAAFDASVAVLFAARDAGAFPPRLREPDRDEEGSACRRCDVKQACLRGDSGARRRLGEWADRAVAGGSSLERAALALWRLHAEGP